MPKVITGGTILIYFVIFIAKVTEGAIFTVRTILTSRDERVINTILGFVQNLIWILTTATVVTNITSDYFKVVAYVLGSTASIYIGMVLDSVLAIGQNMVTVITDHSISEELAGRIREKGYAVTAWSGKGKEKERQVLMIVTRRKREKELFKLISTVDPSAVILSESISISGGYVR